MRKADVDRMIDRATEGAESLQKEKKEWIGLDPEQMRNTPTEFNRGALWAERYLKERNYK